MELLSDNDGFTASVVRALGEIDPGWRELDGLVICGSHDPKDYDEKLKIVRNARENNTPTLGICKGLHYMAVEYARNVLRLAGACDEEVSVVGGDVAVVSRMPAVRCGLHDAGNGRMENHWHNYEINPKWWHLFGRWYMEKSGGGVMETMTLPGHPFYVGVQYHPEYGSSRMEPHPLLVRFIDVCRGK